MPPVLPPNTSPLILSSTRRNFGFCRVDFAVVFFFAGMIFVSVRPPNLVRPNWVWCVTGHPARRQCRPVFLARFPTLLDSRRLRRFNARVPLDKLTIIGAGLLGGSIGLAARARGLARRVSALVRRPESLAECQALGIANEVTLDPAEAVAGADLVVLCTPISGMAGLAKRTLSDLKPGTVITDVGSTKQQLVAELTPRSEERRLGHTFRSRWSPDH